MNDDYANLVAQVARAILSDDDDQSEQLAEVYLTGTEAQKDALDRAFICLCGWSLKTLIEQCAEGGGQVSMAPEWWDQRG